MRSRLLTYKMAGRHPRVWLAVCIALVAFTLLIWGNSMRTATQSAQQSGSVLMWMTPLLNALHLPVEGFHTILRKLAHFSEYGLLGVLWATELWLGTHPQKGRGATIRLGFCMLTAFLDETIQLFVPGRSGEVRDIWIDTSGALLGILFVCLIGFVINRKKR